MNCLEDFIWGELKASEKPKSYIPWMVTVWVCWCAFQTLFGEANIEERSFAVCCIFHAGWFLQCSTGNIAVAAQYFWAGMKWRMWHWTAHMVIIYRDMSLKPWSLLCEVSQLQDHLLKVTTNDQKTLLVKYSFSFFIQYSGWSGNVFGNLPISVHSLLVLG